MLRLNIMDSANVTVLIRQFPEPRTAFNIVMCDREYPYVMNTMISKLDSVYPC